MIDPQDLIAVDRLVAELSPGRQELVREVVVDAVRRGSLPAMNRHALRRMSETDAIADVLEQALADRRAGIPAGDATATED